MRHETDESKNAIPYIYDAKKLRHFIDDTCGNMRNGIYDTQNS